MSNDLLVHPDEGNRVNLVERTHIGSEIGKGETRREWEGVEVMWI